MLRFIRGHLLEHDPELAAQMFRDRAWQFHERQGWEVTVDARGEERDDYDRSDTLYVIWQGADGRHGGSMRLLPTTAPVMVNDHFGHLTGGCPVVDPAIWECTRFCLAPGAPAHVAAALMLGGGEVMTGLGVRRFVGVFDARMIRIYRAIGALPEVLGGEGAGRDRISVGLWSFSPAARLRIARRAGVSPALARHWFERSLGRSAA